MTPATSSAASPNPKPGRILRRRRAAAQRAVGGHRALDAGAPDLVAGLGGGPGEQLRNRLRIDLLQPDRIVDFDRRRGLARIAEVERHVDPQVVIRGAALLCWRQAEILRQRVRRMHEALTGRKLADTVAALQGAVVADGAAHDDMRRGDLADRRPRIRGRHLRRARRGKPGRRGEHLHDFARRRMWHAAGFPPDGDVDLGAANRLAIDRHRPHHEDAADAERGAAIAVTGRLFGDHGATIHESAVGHEAMQHRATAVRGRLRRVIGP